MGRKEDGANKVLNRSRWGLIALAVLIAGGAVALRQLGPGSTAEAQVPGRRKMQVRQAARQPQARAKQPAPTTPPRGTANSSANILAVVNGEPISRNYIAAECLKRWGTETLESLVNKQLITDACKSRGIVISERDIDREISSIAGKFGMSTDQYLDMLRKERDVTATEYRRDILWPTLALKRLAADRLTVTPEQLAKEYESEYGPKVQVRMISVATQSKAQEILKKVHANPDDFAELAKKYSEDQYSASAKGLIPPVRKHMGEPEVEQAVFALQPGQVSPIVHAANQYFIFRCERHIQETTISPQYRKQTEKMLSDRIVERNLRSASGDIFKELQSQAKIVNVMNDATLSKQSPDVAAIVNNQPIAKKTLIEELILRYGRDMVDTEINNRILQQALKRRQLSVTQDALRDEVGRAALSFGYIGKNGEPDLNGWMQAVTEREGVGQKEYVRDAVWPTVALKQLVGDRVKITEDDLEKGFEANYGERVEVLAIVLGDHRVAQTVWDLARKNTSREFFGQLASQYSVEPVSRANLGEIPPIARHGGQPQIEAEAFKLDPTDELKGLSAIVATNGKYIIMKCLGRTIPVVEQMADVKGELAKDIREKKLRLAMADEFDRLREAAQIDNFLAGTSQSGRTAGPQQPTRGKVPARPVSSKSKSGQRILIPTK